MALRALSIGDLASTLGISVDTIRYYEKIGLIDPPERSSGNHRVYAETHIAQLSFILAAREYEFPLKDIEILLGGFRGVAPRCCEVKALTDAHLARVRTKIAKLRALEASLSDLAAACRDDASTDCIIIQSLGRPKSA